VTKKAPAGFTTLETKFIAARPFAWSIGGAPRCRPIVTSGLRHGCVEVRHRLASPTTHSRPVGFPGSRRMAPNWRGAGALAEVVEEGRPVGFRPCVSKKRSGNEKPWSMPTSVGASSESFSTSHSAMPAASRPRRDRREVSSGSRSASWRPNSQCRFIGRMRASHATTLNRSKRSANRSRSGRSLTRAGRWMVPPFSRFNPRPASKTSRQLPRRLQTRRRAVPRCPAPVVSYIRRQHVSRLACGSRAPRRHCRGHAVRDRRSIWRGADCGSSPRRERSAGADCAA
jgi:hypothetical protein